jgi:chemotaxis protein methyltransferase CheR
VREEILALVAERSGLIFASNRHVEADAGISRAMKRAGIADAAAYARRVRADNAALDALVDELTVGETHFLRDPSQMDLLRRTILPALQKKGTPPRIWSAACASGEEAYSLAILLEQAGLDAGALVLGTDLSPVALEKARTASYSDWSMRGVTPAFLTDYFRHVRKRRVLVDRIRHKVQFQRLNLVAPAEYSSVGAAGMDLILCRNVLIYFSVETVARIASRLYASLAEGGVLLTAGSDPLIGDYAPFEIEVTPVGLVYRRPRPGARPPVAAILPPARLPDRDAPPAVAPRMDSPAPARDAPDPGREAFEQVLLLANGMGAFEADVLAQSAIRRLPLDAPLHYLRATLLVALDRSADAETETHRALYLDPSLAVAHFLLGTIQRKRGARREALRAFRNAHDLCAARPLDEQLPAGSGELVGALASAACAEIKSLGTANG